MPIGSRHVSIEIKLYDQLPFISVCPRYSERHSKSNNESLDDCPASQVVFVRGN